MKDEMVLGEEEDDFNRRTPKIINSDEETNTHKNNKSKFQFQSMDNMEELIVEQSREESFIIE